MKVKLQVPTALVIRMGRACAFVTTNCRSAGVMWIAKKQLGRVSGALGIGIMRTKSLESPLAVHSTENTWLYPSSTRIGGCSRFGAALSNAVAVLWLVLHLVQSRIVTVLGRSDPQARPGSTIGYQCQLLLPKHEYLRSRS